MKDTPETTRDYSIKDSEKGSVAAGRNKKVTVIFEQELARLKRVNINACKPHGPPPMSEPEGFEAVCTARLDFLRERDDILSSLEEAGVDNWEGCEQAADIRTGWNKEGED